MKTHLVTLTKFIWLLVVVSFGLMHTKTQAMNNDSEKAFLESVGIHLNLRMNYSFNEGAYRTV